MIAVGGERLGLWEIPIVSTIKLALSKMMNRIHYD